MVVLDVVATDKSGNPVPGLKASDFKVLEGGREQRISTFVFEQPIPSATKAYTLPNTLRLPENTFSNIKFAEQPRTLNVILLDFLNTNIPNQLYAKRKMLQYLETMPANQPTAVYIFTRKPILLQDFTADPKVIKETVNRVAGYRSTALQNPSGGQGKDPLVAPGAGAFIPPAIREFMQDAEKDRTTAQMEGRTTTSIAMLHTMAKALAGYPGRKNLIWVTEGFPLVVNDQRDYTPEMHEAEDALSDSQVAVYAIDPVGVVAFGMDASTEGRDDDGHVIKEADVLKQQSGSMAQNHFTMSDAAVRTGGKAFYNRNDLDTALQTGMADGSTYYTIGYYPLDKNWDGKFRKLEVRVNRPGVNLRYRAGYYATDAQTAAKDPKAREVEIADALDLANPPSTKLLFTAAVTPPSAQSPDKLLVHYDIDVHSITFELGEDGLQHADVTCWARAFSTKGDPIKGTSQTTAASLKPDTYQRILKTAFPCTAELDLPPGNYLLRLAVRDERTGLTGSANGEVTILDDDAPRSYFAVNAEGARRELTLPTFPSLNMPPKLETQAAEVTTQPKLSAAEYCRSIATAKLAPLADACEVATSVKSKLPDFVCNQETSRNSPAQLLANKLTYKPVHDDITAEVQYVSGHESYSNITVNGKPAKSIILAGGMSSIGEFGSMLRNIFDPESAATLVYERKTGRALIFRFRVDGEHSKWFIQVENKLTRLPYHGQLWLEKSTGKVLRVEQSAETDQQFMRHEVKVEYADVSLSERGTFRLPTRSFVSLCYRRSGWRFACFDNTVKFTNYRKFTAHARIVDDTAASEPAKPSTASPDH